MNKKINEFQNKYVLQLDDLTKDKNELLQAIQSLKGKKVILNTIPFNVELIGKIIESEEAKEYTDCDIKEADLELIRILLCINQNKTNYIKCKYNEEIEQCLKDEYVENLIKKKLHIITDKRLGDMGSEDLASVVNSINDPFMIEIYVSYLFILDTKNTREFIKKEKGSSFIVKKVLELTKPKKEKTDKKYYIEIGRKLSRYDEKYHKAYIKMLENLDSDSLKIFEEKLVALSANDFKSKIRRIK